MNTADMVALLRDYVDEATAAHWSDLNLLRRLNMAQNKIATRVSQTPGQWLIKSASVTPSNSVITLPADCAKPIYLEETVSGRAVTWLPSVAYRRISRTAGTTLDTAGYREAYPLLNTIEVNQASYSTVCTLWYQIRVPKLHQGTAGASSGASALHLAADRERILLDDYYNNVVVEVIDQSSGVVDIRSTISDYTASSGVATVTGTPASGDTYGTISRLPEETHPLIVLEATLLAMMKPSANLDMTVFRHYRDELRDARNEIYGWLESRIPEQSGVIIGDPL